MNNTGSYIKPTLHKLTNFVTMSMIKLVLVLPQRLIFSRRRSYFHFQRKFSLKFGVEWPWGCLKGFYLASVTLSACQPVCHSGRCTRAAAGWQLPPQLRTATDPKSILTQHVKLKHFSVYLGSRTAGAWRSQYNLHRSSFLYRKQQISHRSKYSGISLRSTISNEPLVREMSTGNWQGPGFCVLYLLLYPLVQW